MDNILLFTSRSQFRDWLALNCEKEKECYISLYKGKPKDNDWKLYYLDAVEEALCFGWIDSTHKLIDGVRMQRFSPRKKSSPWTELNKERTRRLIKLGLMEKAGRKSPPNLGKNSFKIDPDIVFALKESRAYSSFKKFPNLYQRIRVYNVAFYKKKFPKVYADVLNKLVKMSKLGKMYGEWNDYVRLLDY